MLIYGVLNDIYCLNFYSSIYSSNILFINFAMLLEFCNKIEKDLQLCGYNLLITSEIKANDEEVYNVYHNLWRIVETFRILKR